MFELWKRAWKREPSSLSNVAPEQSGVKKRSLGMETDTDTTSTRTFKRRKTSEQPSVPPFCNEQDMRLLDTAKHMDTIAVFYDIQVRDWVTSELLKWASSKEKRQALQKRPGLYIVRDEADVKGRYDSFQSLTPHLKMITAPLPTSNEDSIWSKFMNNDVVILCGLQLEDGFLSGRLAFSQFNLVIFEHPEDSLDPQSSLFKPARLLGSALPENRPRVLACIHQRAGEVFAYTPIHREMESVLSATIHGVSEHMRQQASLMLQRPKELVVRYDPPAKISDTALYKHLRSLDKGEETFGKAFRNGKIMLRELGPFASDWVWRRLLKAQEENDDNLSTPTNTSNQDVLTKGTIQREVLTTIKNWTFTMPNLDQATKGFNVTPKFAKLVQILQCFQHDPETFRGVILVKRRLTAFGIVELLRTIGDHLPFIRAEPLTGPSSKTGSNPTSVLDDFRQGICNLLVSTKFGEESLDIPPCSVVIRFDLCDGYVSFAQTLGLVNRKEGHVIMMQNRHADSSRQTLRRIARMSTPTREWVDEIAVKDNARHPPLPLTEDPDGYHSASDEEDEEDGQCLEDPTMSGRIYPQDAVEVVYRYISYLKPLSNSSQPESSLFDFSVLRDVAPVSYVCTVLFPDGAPIRLIKGFPCSSKRGARRSACYEACVELFKLGVLSHHFFPRPKEVVRRLRPVAVFIDEEEEQTKGDILPNLPPAPAPPSSAHTGPIINSGQSPTGTRCYVRKKPEFWKNVTNMSAGRLYPTIVTVDRNHNPAKPYRPFLLFTRRPLPNIPDFRLYFSRIPSLVHLRPGMALDVDDVHMNLLHRYTKRVMRAITNKSVTCDVSDTTFLIAPLNFEWDIEQGLQEATWPFSNVEEYIPWDLILFAAEQHLVPLRTENQQALQEDIQDAVIQDRWTEFTRRYDCLRVRADMNPLTKIEKTEAKKDEIQHENVFEWCRANRKGLEGLVDYEQPLIEVYNLPAVINRLQPANRARTSEGPITFSTKFLIPELCSKFTIPASTMRTFTLIPSIMKRIDEILLVRELNAMYFGNSLDEVTLQAAISAPSAGLDMDYERLELLGDAYLKYLSSIYLFVTNPTMHEGILHIARQKIISNRSLLVNSDKSGLPQYIQSKPFTAKLWLPHGYRLEKVGLTTQEEIVASGGLKPEKEVMSDSTRLPSKHVLNKASNDENYQWLGDKCVADVAESIIGAAYQTGGRDLALRIVKSMHIPLPFIDSWEDFALKAKAPPAQSSSTLKDGVLESMETIIGAKFNRPHILAQALTHTSVHGNDMTCYERLEFLGDAILDFLVVQHIFDLYGQLSPGALTLLKGAMVSNSALAAISVHYGLHNFLRVDSDTVKKSIDLYIPALQEKQQAEYRAAKQEGRLPGQYWLEVDPPKSIADVVESILGAIYVSDGFQVEGAQAMYNTILRPFYDNHISLKTLSHHPTKILFELFQSRGCQSFEITKLLEGDVVRCEVVVHDVILAVGSNANANLAARRASFEALDALEGDTEFMTRICDCRHRAEQRRLAKRLAKVKAGKVEGVTSTKTVDQVDSDDGDGDGDE